VPGTAFVNPGDGLRNELTRESVRTVLQLVKAKNFTPIGKLVDERCIVNAMVALLATGGSTNHLIHWVAVARAAGLIIDWDDFSALSDVVPLLTRVYPNGSADVNQFQAAGGPGYVIRELLDAGFMHSDVLTVRAGGIREFTKKPVDANGPLAWEDMGASKDETVVRPASAPFSATGGLRLLQGNLGRSVIKVSAVPQESHVIEAPAQVFNSQEELLDAFNAGAMNKDVVCVVRWQGPQANGMPELHKLTPPLAVLQGQGFKVALVTDGRMSGASGKVPAAIHVSPEAMNGGAIGLVQNGDMVTLTLIQGVVNTFVIFLARIIGGFVDRAIFKNEEGRGMGYFVIVLVTELLLGILASIIVMWFSRKREFRADIAGARLSGARNMIGALEALKRGHPPEGMPQQMAAFGINGAVPSGLKRLFMSHPPLEERIDALKRANGLA
jgi:phosphogluconate dehydratase